MQSTIDSIISDSVSEGYSRVVLNISIAITCHLLQSRDNLRRHYGWVQLRLRLLQDLCNRKSNIRDVVLHRFHEHGDDERVGLVLGHEGYDLLE